jgi:DNA-binding Lrp family transcriptional regulator
MSLDWEIYTALYRQSGGSMWGMLPHPPIGKLSHELGASRVTVWRRFRGMRRVGFLRRLELFPNPRLFGVGLRQCRLRIRDPRARHRLLEELEFVDGAFWAQLDYGRDASIVTVWDNPPACVRREKMIRRIDGVESLTPLLPVWLPGCPETLTNAEWVTVDALRRNPTWSMVRLGEELDISARTVSKRFASLWNRGALLGFWIEDFSKFPGVVVGYSLSLERGTDARPVIDAVLRRFPNAFEPPAPQRAPGGRRVQPTFVAEIPSTAKAGEDAETLLGIPGVSGVEVFFPMVRRTYRHWFDSRIYERLARLGNGRSRPSGHSAHRSVTA